MRKIIQTLLKQVWSAKSDTAPNFVPLTGPINSTLIRGIRVAWEIQGATSEVEVQPAYRMSDDGITWSSTVTGLIGSYSSTEGWHYDTSSHTVDTDLKNFVQFGVRVKNSTSGTEVASAQVALRITARDLDAKSLTAGPEKVWSDGSTTQIFHPLTGGMPAEMVQWYRASSEMQAETGDAQIQPAYQVSDDGITWYSGAASASAGSFTTFATEQTADGIAYGTTFTSFAPAEPKQWVRWGIACRNGSTGVSEACAASLRIDIRGS